MEKIKKTIKSLFKSIKIENIEIDIKKDNSLKDKELLKINIKTDPHEVDFLIKENALGLNALQHLLRLLIVRESLDHTFLILDINDYRKKREEDLNKLADQTVEEVRKNKKAIILEPMSAYERRIIHLKLAGQIDIVSESTGQEPERRVVIRPYP